MISLAPNLTEVLFLLGCGNQLVGVTDYCNYPPEARQLPRLGGLHNPNFERILSLRPRMAFMLPSQRALAARLEKAGVDCVIVKSDTLDDITQGILLMGKSRGLGERSEALAGGIQADLDRIRAQCAGKSRVRALLAVSHSPGALNDLYASGRGTYLDEILTLAGGVNAIDSSPAAYPLLARETVLACGAEVIIDFQFQEESEAIRTQWRRYLGREDASAPRVFFAGDPRLTVPGPSAVHAARAIAEFLHNSPK